jgi:ElaB/YqjD/DUF883 family membrane-anchored ribosome-binding protein
LEESKAVTADNLEKVKILQNQLSSLSSLSREEMRDVRSKIDECLAAVDLRAREHENEIEKYKREIAERQAQYNKHLEVLAVQFRTEKQRLEQQLAAVLARGQNMQKILKQISHHHNTQLKMALQDNEKMKSVIYEARARETVSTIPKEESQPSAFETRRIEQEIAMVNSEITELEQENKNLHNELKKVRTNKTLKA